MNSLPDEIQISVLHTIENQESLRQQWNALVLRMETPQVFFTYEWALAVERAFKTTVKPRVFIFRKKDELMGIAALACDVSNQRRLFFSGASTADYCDAISTPSDRGEVVCALLRELRKLQVGEVFLASIPEESETLKVLAHSKNSAYWGTSQPAYICRRIVFEQKGSAAVSRKAAKTERLRRLAKLGEVSLLHLHAKQEIAPALDSVIKAQVSRFLITNRLSPLLKPERRQFLAELTNLLSPQGAIDLSVLKLNGQEIAWHFGLQFQGVLSWYLPTFDSSLEAHSPGACLLNLVNDESENSRCALKEIDLGLGDEAYKEHFANARRQTCNVHCSANLAGHFKVLLRAATSKAIKKIPSVERFVRAILDRKGEINKPSHAVGSFRRFFARIFSSQETIFFESMESNKPKDKDCSSNLQTLDWNNLASLALQNSDDPEMLEYLRRTSPRIRNAKKRSMQGFVVQESGAKEAFIFWVNDISQADHESPSPLIFDHYASTSARSEKTNEAIECVATEITNQGKTPWISVTSTDQRTLRALENSSFQPRYAIVRRKFIFSMPPERREFRPQPRP